MLSEELLKVFQEGITFLNFDYFTYPIGQRTQGILASASHWWRSSPHTGSLHAGVKGVWNKNVSASEGIFGYFHSMSNPPHSAAWLMTCGAAAGSSQTRGKDNKKTFYAHLGFSVPSSAACQGPHSITRAPKLMPLFVTDAWKMGSFSPNSHCCLISYFLESCTPTEGSPEPF